MDFITFLLLFLVSLLGLDDRPFDPNLTPCVEDEYTFQVEDVTLCVHIEGDGWRIGDIA